VDGPRSLVDYPNHFIARLVLIEGGWSRPTSAVIVSPGPADLRHQLIAKSLRQLARRKQDDPNIVKTWI
jgi:hypothetical protein